MGRQTASVTNMFVWYRESRLRLSAIHVRGDEMQFGAPQSTRQIGKFTIGLVCFFLDEFSDQVVEEVPLLPAEFQK